MKQRNGSDYDKNRLKPHCVKRRELGESSKIKFSSNWLSEINAAIMRSKQQWGKLMGGMGKRVCEDNK